MAFVQATGAPDMQGRVFSLLSSACIAATPIGLLAIGPLADAVGVRVPFVFAGIISIVMGAGSFLIPAILNIETNRQRLTLETQPVDVPAGEATPPAAGVKSTIS